MRTTWSLVTADRTLLTRTRIRSKKRGKRPLPSAEDAASASKKAKECVRLPGPPCTLQPLLTGVLPPRRDSEEGLTEYQKEVKRLSARELNNRALRQPLLK